MGVESFHKINVSGPSINLFRQYAEAKGELVGNPPDAVSYGSIFWLKDCPKDELYSNCEAVAFQSGDEIEIRLAAKNAYICGNLEALSRMFSDLKFKALGWDDTSGALDLICFTNGVKNYDKSVYPEKSQFGSSYPGDSEWVDGMYQLGLDSECLAELNVRGETLGTFNQWLDGKMLSFEEITPTPNRLLKSQLLANNTCKWIRDKYEKELTDWRMENWGTSSDISHGADVCGRDLIGIRPGQITIEFATVWTPPKQAIKRLSQMFPELSFGLTYHGDWEKERKAIMYISGEVCDEIEVIINRPDKRPAW